MLKRCDCPQSAWSKCPHSWTVRYWDNGKQRERSFKRNHKEAMAFSKRIEAETLSVHRGDAPAPISFREYAENWVASAHGAPGTLTTYESAPGPMAAPTEPVRTT